MKLIFMGTPEFAVPALERLVADGHEIAAAFTQPDRPAGRGKKLKAPPIKTLALSLGIPFYQPERIKTNEDVRNLFEQIAPDACIVAAYGKILPEWLLRIPRLGCINVHASLLPKYRGAAPVNWAIANGERETGVTIMQMDAGMDTGPIITARPAAIGEEETAPQLSLRLASLGAELLSESLPLIEHGAAQPVPQNNSRATYAPMLRREHGLIQWGMTAREISNRVRAFQPWPGTYTILGERRLTIWRGRPIDPGSSARVAVIPSTIVSIDKAGLAVACGGPSLLLIEELQIEGKRRISGQAFANGRRLGEGDRIADPGL